MIIVSNIKAVDQAVLSIDQDRTVCATIKHIAETYGVKKEYDLANLPMAVIKITTPSQSAG